MHVSQEMGCVRLFVSQGQELALFKKISIRTILLASLFIALLVWLVAPASSKITMGPITTLKNGNETVVQFSVKNFGLLPLWCLRVEPEGRFLVEELDSTGNLFAAASKEATWERLAFLDEIHVEKRWILNGSRPGIRFKDSFGSECIVWHREAVGSKNSSTELTNENMTRDE